MKIKIEFSEQEDSISEFKTLEAREIHVSDESDMGMLLFSILEATHLITERVASALLDVVADEDTCMRFASTLSENSVTHLKAALDWKASSFK